MNKMKVNLLLAGLCIFLAGGLFTGCEGDIVDSINKNTVIKDIYVEISTLTLEIGASTPIRYWPLPANADIMKLSWTSADPSIATIDRWGRATAVKGGTTTFTVSDGGSLSKTVSVTVPKPDNFAQEIAGAYIGSVSAAGAFPLSLSGVPLTLERVDNSIAHFAISMENLEPLGGAALSFASNVRVSEASAADAYVFASEGTVDVPGLGSLPFTLNGTVDAGKKINFTLAIMGGLETITYEGTRN